MNIDNNLQFHNHVSNICGKVNNQANVLIRFRKLVPSAIKCKLYKAFIAPYYFYCSAVWHFCGARNSKKLDQLNKRVLRIVLNDRKSSRRRRRGDGEALPAAIYVRRIPLACLAAMFVVARTRKSGN